MFRTIAIAVFGVIISTAALADDDWEYGHHHRHHRHHHHHRHQMYDPFYRAYMPPPVASYYITPNQYYVPRPVPYFNQYGYQPGRCEDREDW